MSNLGRVKSLSREIFNGKCKYLSREKILKNYKNKHGYLKLMLSNNGKTQTIQTHQLVAITFLNHIPNGHRKVIDHINDNPSDNRVENLQIVTQRFNVKKTQGKYSSKYKGVSWDKKLNKWRAMIHINGNQLFLGYYINEEDAHLAYQNKLKQII